MGVVGSRSMPGAMFWETGPLRAQTTCQALGSHELIQPTVLRGRSGPHFTGGATKVQGNCSGAMRVVRRRARIQRRPA